MIHSKDGSARTGSGKRIPAATLVPFICLLTLVLCCAPARKEPAPPVDPGDAVDGLFAHFADGDSPGVAVAVIRDGEIVHRAGYGLADLETGTPITPDTTFRLASVSKQLTAMAIMLLAEEGKLDYDDPVVQYLPELERFGSEITIRHLLQHTSGLPDYYDTLEAELEEDWITNQEAVEFFSQWGETLFPAGERYEYSNPGYEMLAAIVERVSRESFREFMDEKIFQPLGMNNTSLFDQTEPEIANRAFGYTRGGDGFVIDDEHVLNYLGGSGGIYSSVNDLFLWDQALYTDRLVDPSTKALAFVPAVLDDGEEYPYGFGWRLRADDFLGTQHYHSGGWLGFSTQMIRYPERRFSVYLLSNLDDFDGAGYARRIVDLYFPPPPQIIVNARLVDGTGSPPTDADVRIEQGHITAVGDLEPADGDRVIDAHGLVLTPGFIDTHSHADSDIFDYPDAEAAVSQGVTTVIVGADGESQLPLAGFFTRLEQSPAAVNVASFVGHGTLREEVMGEDFEREASDEEITAMAELLRTEMEAGALGLSTGLEYDPGIYSTTEEVVTLAEVAASLGGRYTSHLRSEDRHFWEAVDEIIAIGRRAGIPVNITHIKLAMQSSIGQAERLIEILDAARGSGVGITADIYPYTFWQSTLTVLFPERDFEDREEARFALSEISLPEGMTITTYKPDPAVEGMTLAAIAELRGTDPVTTLIDLIRASEAMKTGSPDDDDIESVLAVSMDDKDIDRLLLWPHTDIGTDGELSGPHPRGFGTFTKILGRYVRERELLSLEAAIHKMTGQVAARLGIEDRGLIRPGLAADLVLFDPETVLDRATTDEPHALSVGIERVWVNGALVFTDGEVTDRRPSRVLRRR
jgi:N-acyl-D-aspartate/D-glutamate deacylase